MVGGVDVRRFGMLSYSGLYGSFSWDLPELFNVGFSVCCRHVSVIGDRPALLFGDHVVSFGEMHSLACRFGSFLRELGIKRGDVVGVCLPQVPELVVSWLAIYKLAGVVLSMTPLFGVDAITYRLKHSKAKALIISADKKDVRREVDGLDSLEHVIVVDSGEKLSSKESDFNECLSASTGLEAEETKSDEPAHLFYTSGTTGPPKGVLHAHRFLLGHIPCFQLYFEIAPREGDVFYTPADAGWIGAIGDVILPALYFGMPVVLHSRVGRFNPVETLEILEKYRITCSFIPPTALRMIQKTVPEPLREYDLRLRAVSSAGEKVGKELIEWGREKLGAPVNEFYGCTEANLVVVSSTTLGISRPGALGKPCPGHVVSVINERGEPLGVGEIGYIAVKHPDPVMFLGYLNDPEATRRKFINEWFIMGDLGYFDEDGFLWFVSRADDVIKQAGYRIGPDEVESVINQHPAVLESGVIAKEDELRGSIIKAFIVLKPSFQPSEELVKDIQRFVKNRLAAYAYPREIEFVDELPRTTTGKLQRYVLREIEKKKS